jgi:D-alanyl-D-alanine carboxypeptidase
MSTRRGTDALLTLHAELGIPADYAAARGLASHVEAAEADLVEIGLNPDGRMVRLDRHAADAWSRMRAAAARDGLELIAVSGFRSIARQTEIIREKLAAGRAMPDILRTVAAPGFSEHHTGRALDIGCPGHVELDENFAETPAFRWLEQHAARFGFHLSYPRGNHNGIVYEPWHWCWQA